MTTLEFTEFFYSKEKAIARARHAASELNQPIVVIEVESTSVFYAACDAEIAERLGTPLHTVQP